MELLIEELYKEISKEISDKALREKKERINNNINQLKTIKNFLV